MTEITPGIYQFKIPIPDNPLGNTNSYLIQGDSECLIIDPGINNDAAFDVLQKELTEIGVALEDITQIVATHSHPDHYGLTGRVKQLSQAKILVHHLVRDSIQSTQVNREEQSKRMEPWLRLNGVPGSDLAEFQKNPLRMPGFTNPVMPDVMLQGNETIAVGTFSFQIMWTPGHDPGHICLYEPAQKILFSGDHVLPVITPHISLQTQSDINPLADFINSLNLVKQLDVNLILPGHEQTFTNLQTRIEEIIQHHEQRNSEILAALKAAPKTAYQISTEITWMPSLGGVKFQDLKPWDKRMAVLETLAHLEAMRIKGRVDKSSRDSIIYYQPT